MEYEFHVGQMVRIGNRCPLSDCNYHKTGRVVKLNGKYSNTITVEMIDLFVGMKPGHNLVDWCSKDLWEPVPSDKPFICKSLL